MLIYFSGCDSRSFESLGWYEAEYVSDDYSYIGDAVFSDVIYDGDVDVSEVGLPCDLPDTILRMFDSFLVCLIFITLT
jgi:hypothetical protein